MTNTGTKRRPTIAEAWEAYRDKCVPASASPAQFTESRNAFYVGAYTLFEIITNGLSPGEEPEDADLALLDELRAELDRFLGEALKGRARTRPKWSRG